MALVAMKNSAMARGRHGVVAAASRNIAYQHRAAAVSAGENGSGVHKHNKCFLSLGGVLRAAYGRRACGTFVSTNYLFGVLGSGLRIGARVRITAYSIHPPPPVAISWFSSQWPPARRMWTGSLGSGRRRSPSHRKITLSLSINAAIKRTGTSFTSCCAWWAVYDIFMPYVARQSS